MLCIHNHPTTTFTFFYRTCLNKRKNIFRAIFFSPCIALTPFFEIIDVFFFLADAHNCKSFEGNNKNFIACEITLYGKSSRLPKSTKHTKYTKRFISFLQFFSTGKTSNCSEYYSVYGI